jgi:hypothetical protein
MMDQEDEKWFELASFLRKKQGEEKKGAQTPNEGGDKTSN